jgi:O-antigen/teichoic acid export membrane protein
MDIKVAKNTFSLIIREALNKGALFVLIVLVGRLLGKEALGRYSLALAVSQVYFFGTELGLNLLVVRDVAKERSLAGQFISNLGILRVILGVATMGLIWITTVALGAKGETATVIYLCGLSYFFVSITTLYTSIFRALEKMELETLIAFIKNIIFLPIAIWALFNGFGLIFVFNIFLVSNILALILARIFFLRVNKDQPRLSWRKPDFSFLKGQLRQTLPIWIAQLFGITYLKLAPILLFKIKGEKSVGLYNAGFVVLEGIWVLANCFVSSLFPVISRISRLSLIEARKEYAKGFGLIFSVFSVLGVFIILAAPNIVAFFYGSQFLEIIPLFRLLTIISILVALDTHNGLTMIALGKQSYLPFVNGIGLLVNLVLSIFLILRFDYVGSACALMASEFFVFILMMFLLQKFILKRQVIQ